MESGRLGPGKWVRTSCTAIQLGSHRRLLHTEGIMNRAEGRDNEHLFNSSPNKQKPSVNMLTGIYAYGPTHTSKAECRKQFRLALSTCLCGVHMWKSFDAVEAISAHAQSGGLELLADARATRAAARAACAPASHLAPEPPPLSLEQSEQENSKRSCGGYAAGQRVHCRQQLWRRACRRREGRLQWAETFECSANAIGFGPARTCSACAYTWGGRSAYVCSACIYTRLRLERGEKLQRAGCRSYRSSGMSWPVSVKAVRVGSGICKSSRPSWIDAVRLPAALMMFFSRLCIEKRERVGRNE